MFAKLKDMVWVSDEKSATPAVQPQAKPVQVAAPTSLEVPMPVAPVLDVEAIRAAIVNAIEQQPAFADFLKFSNASAALEKVILVEATRMQAAQATTGLTREQLLASLNTFVAVLDGEVQNFQTAYVGTAEQNIQVVNDQVAAINVEIQELTGKLAELSNKKEELARDALTKSSELAKAKIDFDSIVKSITARYNDFATKVQHFLTA